MTTPATTGEGPRVQEPTWQVLAPILLLSALGAAGMWSHEMWRDELRAWLLVRERPLELLTYLRYESHPPLWYLLLLPLAQAGAGIAAMQVVHLLIGLGAAALFLLRAPLPRHQRWLFTLGYYPFYEYLLISRNYGLVMLLLFAFAAVYRSTRPKSGWVLGGILAAACLTHALAGIVAVAIALFVVLDQRGGAGSDRDAQGGARIWRPTLALTVVAFGACLLLVLPPEDATRYATKLQAESTERYVTGHGGDVARAWLPFSQVARFWVGAATREAAPSWLWLDVLRRHWFQALLSPALIVLGIWLLRPRPRVLVLFLGATLAVWTLLYLKNLLYLRHVGFLYLILVLCLWLAAPGEGEARPTSRARTLVVSVLFALHAAAGVSCWSWDLRHPFSGSAALAAYLEEQGMSERPIVTGGTRIAEVLAALLARPIYHAGWRANGTIYLQDKWRREARPEEALLEALRIAGEEKSEVVLVCYAPLREVVVSRYGLRGPRTFERAWEEGGETFVVYVVPASAINPGQPAPGLEGDPTKRTSSP